MTRFPTMFSFLRRGSALAGMILVAACGRGPAPAAVTPVPPSTPPQSGQAGAPAAAAAVETRGDAADRAARRVDAVRKEVLEDGAAEAPAAGSAPTPGMLLAMTVYFDFDRDELRERDRAAAEAVLAHLTRQPATRVRLEGHADERGSDEYNLALGLRRASMLHRYLTAAGVASPRIQLASFGEERPAVPGSGEAVWSLNRRVEFRVLVP